MEKVQELVEAMRTDWMHGKTSGAKSFDEQVQASREIIRTYFQQQTKGYCKIRGSYGLKHDFERVADMYISENAAIAAFALEGFRCGNDQRFFCGGKFNKFFNYSGREYRVFHKERIMPRFPR